MRVAGVVVTCVEPGEAFVVGKMEKELGINIVEAEVSRPWRESICVVNALCVCVPVCV